jgi:pyridoxamine 5'-phosphate oxidase
VLELREEDVDPDPFVQLQRWLDDAWAAGIQDAHAMTLATADAAGRPSARTVLLKGIEDGGFVFFTNYDSRKGRELATNPRAAVTWMWRELHRQVTATGDVTRVPPDQSDAYFATRPRGSRLGAWASAQSTEIAGRAALEDRLAELEAQYAGTDDIPRPPHWGGYRLVPDRVEVWQHRDSRLHDRFAYLPAGEPGRWRLARLAP